MFHLHSAVGLSDGLTRTGTARFSGSAGHAESLPDQNAKRPGGKEGKPRGAVWLAYGPGDGEMREPCRRMCPTTSIPAPSRIRVTKLPAAPRGPADLPGSRNAGNRPRQVHPIHPRSGRLGGGRLNRGDVPQRGAGLHPGQTRGPPGARPVLIRRRQRQGGYRLPAERPEVVGARPCFTGCD